jgi:adenylosuccinate synthase
MEFENYKYADIKDDSKLKERLRKYEAEIAEEFGEQVVLIAYGKGQNSVNPNS